MNYESHTLRDELDELWKLRWEREPDWRDLLNILQGVLAQEEFERFSSDQCAAVRTIITEYLGAGDLDAYDFEHSLTLLRKAGFDPWRGISGNLESENG